MTGATGAGVEIEGAGVGLRVGAGLVVGAIVGDELLQLFAGGPDFVFFE